MIMGLHQRTMVYDTLTNVHIDDSWLIYGESLTNYATTLWMDWLILRLMISLYTRNHQVLQGNILVLGNYILPNIYLLESSILHVLQQLEVSILCIFSPSCVSFLYLLCLHQITYTRMYMSNSWSNNLPLFDDDKTNKVAYELPLK